MPPRLALAALLLAAPFAHAADCPTAVKAAALQAELDAAEAAFGRADIDAFVASVGDARGAIECLGDRVPTSMAAQLHRIEGLAMFVEDAADRSELAFAAARRLEPSYRFPTSIVPAGNPVLEQYQARDTASKMEPLPAPLEGEALLDGRSSLERPTELPALIQVLADGSPTTTRYLWPGDALPYEAAPTSGGSGPSPRTLVLAGGSAVAAIGVGTLVAGLVSGPSADDSLDDAFRKSTANDTVAGLGGALVALGGAGIGVSFALPTKRDK
jgi:hypothetical protein